MYTKEQVYQKFIVKYLLENSYTTKEKAIEDGNIAIICAKNYYGRYASNEELKPFERAIKKLIESEILISINNKYSVSARPDKYYLDIAKVQNN